MPSITGAELNRLRDLVASAVPRSGSSFTFRLRRGPLDGLAMRADTPSPHSLAIACIAKNDEGATMPAQANYRVDKAAERGRPGLATFEAIRFPSPAPRGA